MPFTIPNLPDAAYTDQAEPDAGDFQILGDHRFGVISGGDATQQGSPNMTVAVAAATVLRDGMVHVVAGSNVTIGAAAATPRFDLIVVNSSGVFAVLPGQANSNPRFPTWDRTSTVLHAVYVPPGTTSIVNALIINKRRMISSTIVSTTAIPTAANAVPLIAKGASSQTADLFQAQSSGATVLAKVDSAGNISGANIIRGTGTPEGAVTAPIGTIYQNLTGDAATFSTSLWVKDTGVGNTGWSMLGQNVNDVAGSWTSVVLGAGFSGTLKYRRLVNVMFVQVNINYSSGDVNNVVPAFFPVGYRPTTMLRIPLGPSGTGSVNTLEIDTSGQVRLGGGTGGLWAGSGVCEVSP